jgi:acyl dehydratase
VFGPAVRIGTPHTAAAIVQSRGERSGWVLMNVHHEVHDQDHEQVLVGSALLAFPAPGATSTSNSVPSPTGEGVRQAFEGTRLPAVVRTLTQQKIDRYAKISGDRNPCTQIHIRAPLSSEALWPTACSFSLTSQR